jgi:hypothetical protein
MEHLFTPCTPRLPDMIDDIVELDEHHDCTSRYDMPNWNFDTTTELNLDVSTEAFLSHATRRGFAYKDLFAMLANEDIVMWLTPNACVTSVEGLEMEYWDLNDHVRHFCFSADGKRLVALASSFDHLVEICDIVVRLLAVSPVNRVILENLISLDVLITAPTLAYLMEQCQSLKFLSLENLEMDENHYRVLGAYSRPDLEIELNHCKLTSAGTSALAEDLGQNQGPTKLDSCEIDRFTLAEILGRDQRPTKLDRCRIDSFVLADGLRGNSRLKSLRPRFSSSPEVHSREVLAIAGALRENKSLVDLDLSHGLNLSDETWSAVCNYLKTHPTLQVLNIRTIPTFGGAGGPAVIKPRIQAILDMLKVNMSIHTIYLNAGYRHHELYRRSVVPYLETNRLRPRLLAIQKTRPIAYRAKVMGQALLAARTDANSFWMLLSGNVEVAFPLRTATIAAAENLTTPATAVANSAFTSNVAAVAASAMSNLTTTATDSLHTADVATTTATRAATSSTTSTSDVFAINVVTSATANVATLSTGQKRKARP